MLSQLAYLSVCVYSLSILKMLYNDPRPYFISDEIKGYGCDSEFGNPSGHAMLSLINYYIVINKYLRNEYFKTYNTS